MSITHVQTVNNNNLGSTSPLTIVMASMGAGNLIRVRVASYPGDCVSNAVTDSQGNTYTKAVSVQTAATGNWASEFWAIAQAGANTVTVDRDNSGGGGGIDYLTVSVGEYNSTTGWPGSPVNTSASASRNATSNPVSPDAVTTVADCLIGASVTDDVSSGTYTPPGGSWTNRMNDYGTTDHNALVTDDQIVTATGTYNCTWTHSSADFGVIIVAYEATAGGSPALDDSDGFMLTTIQMPLTAVRLY